MIKPLRIVTVTPVHCHPKWFASRLARLTTEALMAMTDRGHKSIVISPLFDHGETIEIDDALNNGDGKRDRSNDSVSFYDDRMKIFYCTDATQTKKGLESKKMPGLLAEHLPDADLLYIPGPVTPWSLAAARAARAADRPYVLDLQGSITAETLAPKGLRDKMMLKRYEPHFMQADTVIVQDERESEVITNWNWKIAVEVCPVGLMSQRYNKRTQARLIEDPYILYQGRVEPGKHIKLVIDAFDRIANETEPWQLVFAGPCTGGHDKLLEYIRKKRLTDRIVVSGRIKERKRALLLQYASILACPLEEHEPTLGAIEAMACAIPLLVSPGYHSEEISKSSAGRVEPLEIGAWADALKEMIGDASLRAEMGDGGRLLFEREFRFETRLTKLIDILRQVKSRKS